MEALAGSGTWLAGERFSGSVSEENLKSWIGMGMTVLVIIHQVLSCNMKKKMLIPRSV